MKRLLLIAALLVLGVAAGPAEPVRQDLFSAGEHGFAVYRIPGIVITKQGTLLAYGEARKGDSDWSDERLVLRRSTDGGRQWGEQRELFLLPEPQPMNPLRASFRGDSGRPDARTYHNLVLIPDRDGAVHALFCLDYWRSFYARSDDDGVTWSRPREVTDIIARYREKDWNWRVVGNGTGHGLQLENGRLLVPLWLSSATQGGSGHRPSHVGVLLSDDRGTNWQIGDWAAKHSPPALLTPSETCAVQLADGRVLFNIRHETTNHLRGVSISPNGATGWSQVVFDEALYEPVCEASLVRVSKKPASDRNRILFCNPDSRDDSRGPNQRRNLMLKLSYDEGKTWPVQKVLESGPAGYSDLAVGSDGTIYCLLERSALREGNRSRVVALTLARFSLGWLEGGGN